MRSLVRLLDYLEEVGGIKGDLALVVFFGLVFLILWLGDF